MAILTISPAKSLGNVEAGSQSIGRFPDRSPVAGGTIDNFQNPTRQPIISTSATDPLEALRAIIKNQVPSSITIEDLFTLTPGESQQK